MVSTTMVRKGSMKIWAILFWLVIWQIGSMCLGQEILLVSPVAVGMRLLTLLPDPSFWGSIAFSACRILGGFALAALLGILTAVGAARYTRFRELMAPLVSVIKTTPVASFVILALFWFSSRSLSIFISFLMVFPIVYTNILQGISQTDRQLLEMGQVFGLSMKKKIRYIYFPQAFPYLRSAFAVGLGLCWKAGTAAEVIGIPDGSIGERLQEAKIYLQMPDLFAWTVTIIVVSLLIEKLILWILDVIDRRNRGIGKA